MQQPKMRKHFQQSRIFIAKIAISNIIVITLIMPSYWLTVPVFTGVNVNRSNLGSGHFGGSFNAGDKYINIVQINVFRGQANQSIGFSCPQPQQQQQQQSNFGNQMGVGGGGGSFGNQGNSFSSNAGEFSAVPFGNLIKILVRSFIRLLIRFLCYLSKIKILTLHLD